MAQDAKGKRYDARPKDPAVPPHVAAQTGLNRLQKRAFEGKPLDRPAGKKSSKRKGGRRTRGAETAEKTPAKNGRRTRGKSGARKDASPAPSAETAEA